MRRPSCSNPGSHRSTVSSRASFCSATSWSTTVATNAFVGLPTPEDAGGEPRGRIRERLDRPVVGVRRDAQALAEPAEALVVMRLYRRAVAAEQLTEAGAVVDLDVVVGPRARRVLVLLVADDV